MTLSTSINGGPSGPTAEGGALVLNLASGTLVSILFDALDIKSAKAMIRKAEVRYPLDSTEHHFANLNASLLAELKKDNRNKVFMSVLAAATVELGGRLTGRLEARCMTATTDHRFAGPDQQIGGYDLFAHEDPIVFVEDLVRSLSIDDEWRPL